jgi:hypothetical protein
VKLFIQPGFPEILVLAAGTRLMMLSLNLEVNNREARPAVPAPWMSFTTGSRDDVGAKPEFQISPRHGSERILSLRNP